MEQPTRELDRKEDQQITDIQGIPVADDVQHLLSLVVAYQAIEVGKQFAVLGRQFARLAADPLRDQTIAAVFEIARHVGLPVTGDTHGRALATWGQTLLYWPAERNPQTGLRHRPRD